jgi:hypothetical protein
VERVWDHDHDHDDSRERIKRHWDEFGCVRYDFEATEPAIRESERCTANPMKNWVCDARERAMHIANPM